MLRERTVRWDSLWGRYHINRSSGYTLVLNLSRWVVTVIIGFFPRFLGGFFNRVGVGWLLTIIFVLVFLRRSAC